MTDMERAFLDAILADPADDTPRLIYADWLEIERGEAERAEFIRVQCAIDRLNAELMSGEDCSSPHCPGCNERRVLRGRERDLLGAHGADWAASLARSLGLERWGNAGVTCGPGDARAGTTWTFRRGFLAEVRCGLASWREHGPDLCGEHPVEVVQITDAEPVFSFESYSWWCGGNIPGSGCNTPEPIWRMMPPRDQQPSQDPHNPSETWGDWKCFDSEQEARAALDAAALLWAQTEAKRRREEPTPMTDTPDAREQQALAVVSRWPSGVYGPTHLARLLNLDGPCAWCPVLPPKEGERVAVVPAASRAAARAVLGRLVRKGLLVYVRVLRLGMYLTPTNAEWHLGRRADA